MSYLRYLGLLGSSLPSVVCEKTYVLFTLFVFVVCERTHVLFTLFVFVVCERTRVLFTLLVFVAYSGVYHILII